MLGNTAQRCSKNRATTQNETWSKIIGIWWNTTGIWVDSNGILVGGLVAIFYFPINLGLLIIPIDVHIFQRCSNHQPVSFFCFMLANQQDGDGPRGHLRISDTHHGHDRIWHHSDMGMLRMRKKKQHDWVDMRMVNRDLNGFDDFRKPEKKQRKTRLFQPTSSSFQHCSDQHGAGIGSFKTSPEDWQRTDPEVWYW